MYQTNMNECISIVRIYCCSLSEYLGFGPLMRQNKQYEDVSPKFLMDIFNQHNAYREIM